MSLSAFDQWAMLVLWGIYTIAWQSSLLIVLVWLVLWACKKASPRWKHLMWLIVVVRLLLPPLFSLPTSIGNWGPGLWEKLSIAETALEEAGEEPLVERSAFFQPVSIKADYQASIISTNEFQGQRQKDHTVFVEEPGEVGREGVEKEAVFPIYAVLFIVWFCGVIYILGLSLWQTRRFSRSIISLPEEYGWVRELARDACCKLGYKRNVDLCSYQGNQSPVVIGLIRPRLVLSRELFEHLSREEIYSVLLHEIAHLKRKDHWVVVLQVIAKAVHFYHPLVWMFMVAMDRERECDCDDVVLGTEGVDKTVYANSLNRVLGYLGQPSRLVPGMLGMAEMKSEVGKRIARIFEGGSVLKRRMGMLSVVFAAVFALVFTSFTPVVSADVSEKEESVIVLEETEPESLVPEKAVSENEEPVESKQIIDRMSNVSVTELEAVEEQFVLEEERPEPVGIVEDETDTFIMESVPSEPDQQNNESGDESGFVFTDQEISKREKEMSTPVQARIELTNEYKELTPSQDDITKRFAVPDYLVDQVAYDLSRILKSPEMNLEQVSKNGVGLDYHQGGWYLVARGKPDQIVMVGDLVKALIKGSEWIDPEGRFDLRQGFLYELRNGNWEQCHTLTPGFTSHQTDQLSLKRVRLKRYYKDRPVYELRLGYQFRLDDYQYLPRKDWDDQKAFDLNYQVMLEGIKAFLAGKGYVLVHQQGDQPDVNDLIEVVADGKSLNGLDSFLWSWSKSPLFEEPPIVYICSTKQNNYKLLEKMQPKLPNNRYRLGGRYDSSSVIVACTPKHSENLYDVTRGLKNKVHCEEAFRFAREKKEKYESVELVVIQHGFVGDIARRVRDEFQNRPLVVTTVGNNGVLAIKGSKQEVRYARHLISRLDVEKPQYTVSCVFITFTSTDEIQAVEELLKQDALPEHILRTSMLESDIDFHLVFTTRQFPLEEGTSFYSSSSQVLAGANSVSREEKYYVQIFTDTEYPDTVCLTPLTYEKKSVIDSENIHKSWTVKIAKDKPSLFPLNENELEVSPENPRYALLVRVSEAPGNTQVVDGTVGILTSQY